MPESPSSLYDEEALEDSGTMYIFNQDDTLDQAFLFIERIVDPGYL